MPKKPKKPRKEPAEKVLIIGEWDKWVEGKTPKGKKRHGNTGTRVPWLLGSGEAAAA
jgi:hypothetical protein